MKHYTVGLVALMMFTSSQANMISDSGDRKITKWSATTAIEKEQALANYQKPKIPKFKIFRSNPLRKSLILEGQDPYDTVDDEDFITNNSRQGVQKRTTYRDDEELPEHIRWRLFLARQLALLKYKEIHG